MTGTIRILDAYLGNISSSTQVASLTTSGQTHTLAETGWYRLAFRNDGGAISINDVTVLDNNIRVDTILPIRGGTILKFAKNGNGSCTVFKLA